MLAFVSQEARAEHVFTPQAEDSLAYNTPRSYVDLKPLSVAGGVLAPLVAYDLLFIKQDAAIQRMRHHYLPNFSYYYDNLLPLTPLAATWGMRLAGIEGRSQSTQQALISQGLSAAISSAVVMGGKWATGRMRPDGSSPNSFPSHHTSIAFLSASILDAEYGEDYPWLAALGYGVAGITGVTRVMNNRHWATDVVTGAGVGIASTYVGYLLGDLIMGRGTERYDLSDGLSLEEGSYPWMISLDKGFHTLFSSNVSDFDCTSPANIVGLTVRAPLYQHWGLLFSGHLIEGNDSQKQEQLNLYALMAGVSYMRPIWSPRLLGSVHASLGYLSEGRLSSYQSPARKVGIPFLAPGATARVGAELSLITTPRLACKLNANYWVAPLSRPYDRSNKIGLHGLEYGLSLSYLLH